MNTIISSKRTAIFIFVLSVITIFSLFVALTPQSATMETAIISPTPIPIVQTTLSFNPQQMQVKQGIITLQNNAIDIDTGTNKVHVVQLELGFDPKVVEDIDILPGTFFAHPTVQLKNIDYSTGRISFALSSDATTGKGILATLSFSIIPGSGQKQTSIVFLPKTFVGDKHQSTSVLKETTSLLMYLNVPITTP